jgi:dGTPase
MLKTCDRIAREALEDSMLSSQAAHARDSLGRLRPEEPDEWRTCYQRDRDRILHSKSFRRLMHKTQVFLSPEGDHYRTRLTHTLEVSQIARSIARSLSLNEDLTEAIALGHDLGHTPFGHTGEDAISRALARHLGRMPQFDEGERLFHHNQQSVRIVEFLEKNGQGLNLTREVVDGIEHHTGPVRARTLEGRTVAISDRIAYVNHDVDDAIRAGILSEDDLPDSTHHLLGWSSSSRIDAMVRDTVAASAAGDDICMSPSIGSAMEELRSFLFANIYTRSDAKGEEPKANRMIELLFDYYVEHFDEVPEEYRHREEDPELVRIADYIAGMTDRYATRVFQDLYTPRSWAVR